MFSWGEPEKRAGAAPWRRRGHLLSAWAPSGHDRSRQGSTEAHRSRQVLCRGANAARKADERPPDHTVARWCERYFPEKKPDVIVFGDTHTELIRNVGGVLCVNPGSPTYPHNYDTQFGTLGFLELDAGKARASVWLINETGIEPYDWDHPPKWKL